MTEIELYRLLAQPTVFALGMLFLMKAPWRARVVAALVVAVVGVAAGYAGMLATRAGAPSWIGWAVVPATLILLGIGWGLRRTARP